MHRWFIVSAIGGLFFGGLLWISATAPRPAWAAATGSISGRVVLVGEAPAAKKIPVTKDGEKCGTEIVSEELVISPDKGIKNAVITITGVPRAASTDKTATIDQKGCTFKPHVVVSAPGSSVDIVNSDGILHNFHTYSSKNTPVNKAQPGFKKKMSEAFAQPEVIKVNCDAHSWMAGWIVVSDNASVVSEDGGAFKLVDVPAGTHKLEIWHETLGKITKEVSVKAGEDSKVTIELSKK